MPAWVAPLIGMGINMMGNSGMFGGGNRPMDPISNWYNVHGASNLDYTQSRGRSLIENPYGIGDSKKAMRSIGRDTFSAGQAEGQRRSDASFARSGLSQGGGSRARMDYYAGNQMAEGLNKVYNQIEIIDEQAREQQRARGENMLMSISNQNSVYSQLSSQNYWNQINEDDSFAQSVGQSIGSTYQNYLASKNEEEQGEEQGEDRRNYDPMSYYNMMMQQYSGSDTMYSNPYGGQNYGNPNDGEESQVTPSNPWLEST